ncbi:MAG: adenosylcobinamide-GDP ribazoletransferase [Candidatus Rokubacteria bacterium]|nr:adenosylcobinamide-GDP ribazoletransferase [Candidatus Rokubacteria bacterium]
MSGLTVAARYLTILPIPGGAAGGLERVGRAAAWFPVVGFAIGAAVVIVERVTVRFFPPLLVALLVVTAWKLASGGLHLDGLADCFDGLVGHDASHRLAIMRDSRIGAFGAIGLILFLFLEIAAIVELPSSARIGVLLVAPTIGRTMPVLVARLFASARADGHGAAFRGGLGRVAAPAALTIALVTALGALGWAGVVALAVATVAAVALGRFMAARLGGVTGDVLGASVEVAELAVLLTASAWIR